MRIVRYIIVYIVFISISLAQGSSYQRLLDAAELGRADWITDLLDKGMDPNTVDSAGNTLLMLACSFGQREVVTLLLKRGADSHRRNRVGDSALMVAVLNGYEDLARLLVGSGAEIIDPAWSALHYAAFGGRTALVKYLLELGAEKDQRAPNGYTALMLAVRGGHTGAVRELLYQDADLEVAGPNGETALSLAVKRRDSDVEQLLRRAGAIR